MISAGAKVGRLSRLLTMEEGRDESVLQGTGLGYSKKPIKFGATRSSKPAHVVSALLLVSVILWLMANLR